MGPRRRRFQARAKRREPFDGAMLAALIDVGRRCRMALCRLRRTTGAVGCPHAGCSERQEPTSGAALSDGSRRMVLQEPLHMQLDRDLVVSPPAAPAAPPAPPRAPNCLNSACEL
eukprot:8896303-Pyramimonas_sp.AAC.1